MKTQIKNLFYVLVSAVLYSPVITHADSSDISVKITNPLRQGDNLIEFINQILQNIVMPIAAVLSVGYIIWGGFLYLKAQGKPAEIEKANKNILWALIGVGVLLGAAGISSVITATVSQFINP